MALFTSEMEMNGNVPRLLIILACAMVIAMFPAAATPIPTCPDGASLATYITDFGVGVGSCQIGDKIFSNFAYSSSAQGGATQILSSGVTVDTLGPTGGLNPASILSTNIGLQFGALWQAGQNQTSDGTIDFSVQVANGGPMMITDVGLAQLSGINSTGSASVAELGCAPAVCDPSTGNIFLLTFQNGVGTPQFSNEVFFSPVGSISVEKDIGVSGGTATDGFASLSRVVDTFSQTAVPEPRALSLLLGLGLAAGVTIRKKFQSVRS